MKKTSTSLQKMLLHLLQEKSSLKKGDKKALQVELAGHKEKLENLEKRFVIGEIDQTMFYKYRDKFRSTIHQIESELDISQNQLSNLEKSVIKCIELALELPSIWRNSNFGRKQRIQNLLFPE